MKKPLIDQYTQYSLYRKGVKKTHSDKSVYVYKQIIYINKDRLYSIVMCK
jgi:hypothetical protein